MTLYATRAPFVLSLSKYDCTNALRQAQGDLNL